MRTGSDLFLNDEYEGGTIAGIDHYFSTFEEPFIKGLLRDKGGKKLLFKIEDKHNQILFFMRELVSDFNQRFQGIPIYLYLKCEYRSSESQRSAAFNLIWRVSRRVCGTGDNTMITYLFSNDGKHEYLLKRFGPEMRKKLREYDKYRLSLNVAENLLRHQKKSIQMYRQATSLV